MTRSTCTAPALIFIAITAWTALSALALNTDGGTLLPNLRIVMFEVGPPTPRADARVEGTAVIENNGPVGSPATEVLIRLSGATNIDPVPLPALAPGEQVTVQTTSRPLTTAQYAGTIAIDPGNLVAESDELDNEGARIFVVLPLPPLCDPKPRHTADQDADNLVSLSELLRVIQFFNTGSLGCDSESEDGYAPGGADTACCAHNSDYDSQDWQISLSELLRLIQFFNSAGYAYLPDASTEDSYRPGRP